MILVIDNVDSFVFNLARHLQVLGREVRVVRHDAVTIPAITALAPEAIVVSPGPCGPHEAGISTPVIQALGARARSGTTAATCSSACPIR